MLKRRYVSMFENLVPWLMIREGLHEAAGGMHSSAQENDVVFQVFPQDVFISPVP
jgi:hypothetical protein